VGRAFRRSFAFDGALLKPVGNEILLRLNENAAAGVGTTVAYDALKLELDS
jgi:hypothetical protein